MSQKKVKEFWADKMASEVEQRLESDEQLKAVYEKQGLLVYDEKTPSGVIHIGSGRGWVIHDVIAKALRKRGLKAEFILSSDDFDPYDKPNKDLPEEDWNQHLGKPFSAIPSPVEGFSSFGAYYFNLASSRFKELGIECGFESTAQNYIDGVFDEQIKTILDNTDKVQDVYRKIYKKESDATKKLPFNVICPQCGKIATTLADQWDQEKELIHFSCKSGVVQWADGCGYEGWISPYKGGGKFPWKVEWACKWPGRGVLVEFGGKDHFSKGGSREVANRIAMDVLNYPPPYPSRGYFTGKGYEFFQVGGAKMSTSKGRGMSFSEGVDFFPPELLRYLLLKSKPNSVVDFDPEKNDIILLTEQYDKMERVHFGIDEAKEEDRHIQSRIYDLSTGNLAKNEFLPQVPLVLASTTWQTTLSLNAGIEKLQSMGHLPKELSEDARAQVERRFALAQRWLENYASDQFLFRLVSEDAGFAELEEDECKVVSAFADFIENTEEVAESKELHNKFYEFAREQEIEPKMLFRASYRALISRERGPQLAGFIMTIGFAKSAKLLRASVKASQG